LITLADSDDFTGECFALLDDCNASGHAPRSRLYTGYLRSLMCRDSGDLPALWSELHGALRVGCFAVGLFTYELGAQMQGISADDRAGAAPYSRVLLFSRCEQLSADDVANWLAGQGKAARHGQAAGILHLRQSVDEAAFSDAIARIHAYIAAGDTYQVNYTYRLRFDAFGGIHALYARLRQRQQAPYGALIGLPDGGAILSLSPELFIRHEDGKLLARPMKGTAAASGDEAEDAGRAAALAADPKNRAENVMIVDLLRNDLGRIAAAGSVAVPALFEVARFGSVLQMTSTVEATPRSDATLADIFAAVYPCGSITGAPKRRTMQIIRECETAPRGFYTGAIGWFDAPAPSAEGSAAPALGDFCLSVPIRTLVLSPPDRAGLRAGELGVGAGIVHDSVAADEYAECQLKARFLTALPPGLELFETMHASRETGCRHLDRHLDRLRASARYFGFRFDEPAVRASLQALCSRLAPGAHRIRLALQWDGVCSFQHAPLSPIQERVDVLLASRPVASDDLFLHHKTSVREPYDAAWRAAEAQGAFDMLFVNERGELTEGGRSNVFLRIGGGWHTPPLSCGVLPGVMRAVLLADPAWQARESILTLQDLRAADAVIVCNALRGALPARVVWVD
jgi:para-aminobenzoate synthetase/4-amino-4-deoxychorismate lyase